MTVTDARNHASAPSYRTFYEQALHYFDRPGEGRPTAAVGTRAAWTSDDLRRSEAEWCHRLTAEQVDDNWKYLKEGMPCSMTLYNGNPITMAPPNHVELLVTECEPGAKGDTATNVTKPAMMETGAEFLVPGFIKTGNVLKIDTRTGEYVERVSN